MARPEAVAVGGYFPTPLVLIPAIAALAVATTAKTFAVVDPCAGEGDAVCALIRAIFFYEAEVDLPNDEGKTLVSQCLGTVDLYTCEMEASRFAALESRKGKRDEPIQWDRFHAVKGDAFRVVWSLEETRRYRSAKEGASLLFLNPPYMGQGVWENRFLERFANVLADGGVLLFLIPYKSLAPCADVLAREFKINGCFRFPEEHFQFSQVVLVATKRPTLLTPDPKIQRQLVAWSEAPESIPVLPANPEPCAVIPGFGDYKAGFGQWAIAPIDLTALRAKTRPWHGTDRGGKLVPIPGIVPDRPVRELLSPTYPVAMPPRAAHIAAGIAAGVFNGARIAPDDPSTGLPEILVKGTFTRDFVTVEEKENADGEVIGEVQVQQPKLVVTALDLRSLKYHTIRSSTDVTGSKTVEGMTTADLLATYGSGLMRVMLAQCPVLHDPKNPAHEIPLPSLKRTLYRAQSHAVMATVKLLGGLPEKLPQSGVERIKALRAERRKRIGKAAFVLGEIGSGKSTVALAACTAIGARSVLVMCPPHLLQSWRDQAEAVVDANSDVSNTVHTLGGHEALEKMPSARTFVLEDVEDIERLAASKHDGMIIAILSRETAKLGHAWGQVSGRTSTVRGQKIGIPSTCPACGAPTPGGDLAKLRARCEATKILPANSLSRAAFRFAEALVSVFPAEPAIRSLFRGRMIPQLVRPIPKDAPEGFAAEKVQSRWEAVAPSMRRTVLRLLDDIVKEGDDIVKEGNDIVKEGNESIFKVAKLLLHAIGDDALTEVFCEELYESTLEDDGEYGKGAKRRQWAREAALLMLPNGTEQKRLRENLFGFGVNKCSYSDPLSWEKWDTARDELSAGVEVSSWSFKTFSFTDDGRFTYEKHVRGAAGAALAALELLCKNTYWQTTYPCDEPLFEASAELVKDGEAVQKVKRYPLATYIAKYHPDLFDTLVLDEGHEYSGEGSAQGFAAHRLVALRKPTILLTGSVMNGYARSLFANQWACDPVFRSEFKRDDIALFERRYGYIRQFVDFREGGKPSKNVEHGAVTDRVEVGAKTIGSAPGVLPLFILRYLLRISVTLHKSDLAIELPAHRDGVTKIKLDVEMRERFTKLQNALVAQIKRDRFNKDRAGRLFGQLGQLPAFLDMCTSDTGNAPGGKYVIAYPESVDNGRVIAEQDPFPASTILPKERWMLDTIKDLLANGIRPIVYGHNEIVLPRLARLIEEELGWKKGACPILFAKKVPASKRQEWIDAKVIKAKREVLVVNPMAVQTGLNNLVWFRRALWMQNPACNPIVKRQADGRIDRIGKSGDTESIFPVYEDTMQEVMHKLLMHKVGVSMATDGLDAESALSAAGVGSGGAFETLSIGRQLFKLLTGE